MSVQQTETTSPTTASRPVSERLIGAAASAWEAKLDSRFIREATDGTLSADVLARYMLLEAEFVTVAARALGSAILRAPGLPAIRGHAATLASFIGDQHDFFDQVSAAGGAAEPGPNARRRAEKLGERVLEICETGSYAEIVACMYPSERLYALWCSRAAAVPAQRSEALQEWITSHAELPYIDTVDFLTHEVDSLVVSDDEIERLGALVSEILHLEMEFLEACYDLD
jgi:thiaminase (transcriptional activator TenA)